MQRDRFPEKVPFRLTRMIVNAMEVSGIEGNFRSVCEAVMRVLRENKDSVMAMLEAFVHDPLINWRLLNTEAKVSNQDDKDSAAKTSEMQDKTSNETGDGVDDNSQPRSGHFGLPGSSERLSMKHRDSLRSNTSLGDDSSISSRRTSRRHSDISSLMKQHGGLSGVSDMVNQNNSESSFIVSQSVRKDRSLAQRLGKDGENVPSETINQRALAVINRVRGKLDGRDFGDETLAVPDQVDRLIVQATSIENLSQLYIGWCPFW